MNLGYFEGEKDFYVVYSSAKYTLWAVFSNCHLSRLLDFLDIQVVLCPNL